MITTYRYTAAGDLAEQRDPEGLKVELAYDALGRLRESSHVSEAHPDGVKTVLTYDVLGRLATQTEPGVRNEVSGVTHTRRTTYAYDPDGSRLRETVSDLSGGDAERATVYTYDDHGRVETITDPEGGVVRQSWNTIGRLATVTDARGAVVEHAYSERGELLTQTLKGWTGSPVDPQPATDKVLASFGYDAASRLVAQSDAMGRRTSFEYFGDNLLAKKIADNVKLNGSGTARDVELESHTYDAAGNQIKLVTGDGNAQSTTEYVYDAAGFLTSQTFDPGGLDRRTAFTYDANGNIIKTIRTGADGDRAEVTEQAYTKTNLPTRTTVENGDEDIVTTVDYDDRGLAVATTEPRGNVAGADAEAFTTEMRYDALGRLVETTGPQVKVDKDGAADDSRPAVRFGYDAVGATTHETDAEGRTVVSVFDKAGRLTGQKTPSYTPPGGTALTPTTSLTYDAAGQLTSTTDPRGHTTTFDYDKLGRQVRVTDPAPEGQQGGTWVTEYDMAGEKLATVDPTGARTGATYDDLGRQITATQIERKPSTASYTTTMEYDDAGRLVKQTAPGGKVTTYGVNAAGEVTSVTDPNNNTTGMAYDLAGRLIKTTDPNGNATTAGYDLAGRQITAKDLDRSGGVLRTYRFGHDAAGNKTSLTSPEGHVTQQTFDALGRPTTLIEPVSEEESITTSLGYDATGARTRLTDGRGNATWTTYNSLGLAETVTEPATAAHPDAADRTWTHLYDAAGNPVATLQPGGVRIDRTFDHLGRLTQENGAGGDAATAERSFGYDLANRMTTAGNLTVDYNDRDLPLTVTRGSTQETAYRYDALGNPTQRVDAAGTATFTWDNASRLKTATDPVTNRTLTYGYDPAGRLKTITATSGQAGTQSFDYDAMDRLTGQTLENGSGTQLATITYGWDKDDNLTTKTTTGTAGAGTNTYAYDHAGRLTSWTAPDGATTAYEWDAAGNRTKAGDKTFTYDERNRLLTGDGSTYTYTSRGTLATETKAGTTTGYTFDAFDRLIADGDSVYAYDALDRLTSRIHGTTKQTFAYAGLGNDLAAITDSSGTVQARYARDTGGGLLGLTEGTGAAVAAFTDLHGDLVATYTTTLQTSTAYDPFGAVTAQTGTTTNLGYQGEYTDPDTGKVNMHARWYQPGTGTFTSRDTMTLNPNPSVQANRYTYANASPLTGTDPTGHATVSTGSGHYTPGIGYQSATEIYAQHGIVYGGDEGGEGGYCIGSCGISRGGGPIGCDTYGGCGAVVTNMVNVMTIEEMKRQNVLPNGWNPPNGFWKSDKGVIQEFIRQAYTGIPPSVLSDAWKILSSGIGAPGASSSKSGITCSSYYGTEACKAIKKAAKIATRTKQFLNECLGPFGGGIERCLRWRAELGISDETWNRLRKESWDRARRGENITDEFLDFFFGDAADCANGSVVACGLFAVNFIPGAGLAKAGIKGLGKIFAKISSSGARVAKACSSFAPGTLVLMADGSRQPIEDIRVGDEVLATDPATGETVAKKVTALINSTGTKNLIEITIRPERKGEANFQSVIATAQHPFWVPSLRDWVDATYLKPGAWLRTSAGTWIQVVDVKRWTASQQVHNLSVADIHTYYVLAGDQAVLVHNANPCAQAWKITAELSTKIMRGGPFGARYYQQKPNRKGEILWWSPDMKGDGGLHGRFIARQRRGSNGLPTRTCMATSSRANIRGKSERSCPGVSSTNRNSNLILWEDVINETSNKILDYAETCFVLGANDPNREARENLATFSMGDASELDEVAEAILAAGIRLRARFATSRTPITFYVWYDEQAGQLRLSVVSTGVDELPFRGKYRIVHELDSIIECIKSDAAPGFISWNDLEEVGGDDDEVDIVPPPFPVFVVPIV
ncbi:polymorphic toxin-type HINT domain-containing protein [Nonomuraea longispora]|uniref:polymorphic toxin-type HINT domain-containing protein n=1 Tax=Nonomuraea longispora TaxID=1848320 RepID=UPI0014043A98|nr:polymorphic toxin-type HINT domain-containing protein [Nonomuraea longispora]